MLGGSQYQVHAIKEAREMGLYVITCDYLPNNPGHKYSHEYHNVSTTDRDAVLGLAQKLKVDGVVCYASDPAASTAAFVCEKLDFPTNPLKSVEILSNKDKFREFLTQHNFNVPRAKGFSDYRTALKYINNFKFPVMVKPVDSSGCKGVNKIFSKDQLSGAISEALRFSKAKRFIIEEFIQKKGYQVSGDGFSVDGILKFRSFGNEHYGGYKIKEYVPLGESWPSVLSTEMQDKIHSELQRLLSLLKMKTGAYNIEVILDENDNVYILELGARNGGSLIPQIIKYTTGVDLVRYTIKAALGEDCSSLAMKEPIGFWSNYMVHSIESGNLKEIRMSDSISNRILIEFETSFKKGDPVNAFKNSGDALGTMILKYSSLEEMLSMMNQMYKFVNVVVE